jgi:hypothetical protein
MIPVTVLEFADRGLSVVDPPAARGGQGSELKTVWISVASIVAVVLSIAAGMVVVVAHRRGGSRAPTTRTESGGEEVSFDIESSLAELEAFLSEENALSQDGGSLKRKLRDGREWPE